VRGRCAAGIFVQERTVPGLNDSPRSVPYMMRASVLMMRKERQYAATTQLAILFSARQHVVLE
jgi:hypothetical protein